MKSADRNQANDYDSFAEMSSAESDNSLVNAFYERPAMPALAGDVTGRRILYVGCGSGPLSAALPDRGAVITGIDASAGTLARRRLGDDVALHVVDLCDPLPFDDGTFDDVAASLVDDPSSWFEELCIEGDDPSEPTTVTIPISSLDSPAITGELAPFCTDCPKGVEQHSLADHMPDQDWVDRTIRSYGEDHPYVIAKVYARFPKGGGGGVVIPPSWVDAAMAYEDPTGEGWHRLCDLGLEGESAEHTVREGAWVRLGVDIAADGGDEFTIFRSIGDAVEFRHASAGAANDNQVSVAEKVLEEIHAAQLLADTLGSPHPVRVKLDQNGIGHGVVSMLQRWAETGRHRAQIVGVMVSESPSQDDPGAIMRPWRKRDEMWLATRSLLQPDPSSARGRLRLRIDKKAAAQLSTPKLTSTTSGYTQIESKKATKARGMKSPDRAEAVLLALYEPEPLHKPRNRGLLN